MSSASENTWYHGTTNAHFTGWKDITGIDGIEGAMCLSKSSNVARRYGEVWKVHKLTEALPKISLKDWLDSNLPESNSSFVVTGDESYDFPVDMLILRSPEGVEFEKVENLRELDDGLAYKHDPDSESDRQFELYVRDHYDSNVDAWYEENDAAVVHMQP